MDRNVIIQNIANTAFDHYRSVPPPMLITFDHAHVIFLLSNRLENGDSALAYNCLLHKLCPHGVHPQYKPDYEEVKSFVYTQCRSYVGLARSLVRYSMRSFYFANVVDATLFKLKFC